MKNSRNALDNRNKLRRYFMETVDKNSFPHEIIKICKKCGEEKYCKWNRSFTSKGLPMYRSACEECESIRRGVLRKSARPEITKQKRERARKNKQKCVDYLGGKCCICGYNKTLSALTFHHRDPKEKSGTIGVMIQNISIDNNKLVDELDKCDLLCFNCHMEIHWEESYVECN